MKYLILGAGALGGYYGGLLKKGGADVTFLVRPKAAARLTQNGLIIKLENEYFRSVVKTITVADLDSKYDVIFLTCKSYDLEEAIKAIEPAVGDYSSILPFLNGINHIDILIDKFGKDRVLGGTTQFLVNQNANGTILPTFQGSGGQKTIIGSLTASGSEKSRAIVSEMQKTMPDATYSDNILKELWLKLSGAGPSFTVAGLLQVRAGIVASSNTGKHIVAKIFDECASICAAEGYPPPPEMKTILSNLWSEANVDYGPSLLADIENSRQTEGQHVVGDLVKRAKSHGISVPLLEATVCRLEIYENSLSRK